MFFVCVDNDVEYFFVFNFPQNRPVVSWVGLSDVDLNILGGWRPDQLLESDQPVFVLVEDCHPSPVEEQHHILQQVITSHTIQGGTVGLRLCNDNTFIMLL